MAPLQGRVGGDGLPGSFVVRMLDRSSPPRVCCNASCGIPCPRINCLFAHQVHTQQQPQPRPHHIIPPPPPPPPPPQQPQPHQAAGRTGAGGGGGGQRPPSVALYNRNFTEAAGAARDGVLAATDSTGSDIRQGRPKGGQGRKNN